MPGMLYPFFDLHNIPGSSSSSSIPTDKETEISKSGLTQPLGAALGFTLQGRLHPVTTLSTLLLGLWPCIQPEALAMLRCFHISQGLWSSLSHVRSMIIYLPYLGIRQMNKPLPRSQTLQNF